MASDNIEYHWVWCSCHRCIATRLAETSGQLISLAEWRKMPPKTQGYALYMQAELPNSELKNQTNPYPEGSAAHRTFEAGVQAAVREAQDSEE